MRGIQKTCAGIDKDTDGGMTAAGRIICDARAFGILPEHETRAGRSMQAIHGLWTKTQEEREKYGHQVSQLPEDIRERYVRIRREAFDKARKAGRGVCLDDND